MQKKGFISLLLILALATSVLPTVRAAEATQTTGAVETTETTEPTAATETTGIPTETAEATETTGAAETTGAPTETAVPTQAAMEETPAETEPAETTPEVPPAVTAAFLFQPRELTLTIFTDPEDASSIIASKKEDPRIYSLFPGRYLYTATCDGFRPVMDGVLEITESSDPLFFDIVLEPIPEEQEADHYTVTFDPCGGVCAVTTAVVKPGGPIGNLPIPSREGYTFAGWYQGECYCDPVRETTRIEGDQTLLAHWARTENDGVRVRFDPNGGSLPEALLTAQAQQVNSGSSLSVYDIGGAAVSARDSRRTMAVAADGRALGPELTVPTDGLLLDSRTAPSTGRPTAGTAFVETIPEGAYIGFDYESRIISVYGSRDGLLAHHSRVTPDSPYGPLPVPVREGFAFAGWYTSPLGGTQVYEQTAYSGSEEPVLYAHWKSDCIHAYTAQRQEATCQRPLSVRYSCSRCGDTLEFAMGQGWCEWSLNRPWNIPETLLEAREEYRFQCRETTVSEKATLPGWQRENTETVWGDYGPWSDWSLTPAACTDAVQVDTAPMYRYFCFTCARCRSRNPYPGACGCDAGGSTYQELWSPLSYEKCQAAPASGSAACLAVTFGQQFWYFAAGNQADTALGTLDANGESPVIRLGYRSRSRTTTTRSHFSRWSDWSDWSQEAPAASPSIRTERRTTYRFYSGPLGAHTYEDGVCTVCGEIG